MVEDGDDVRVHDPVALAEIEMTTELMIYASKGERVLTQEEIDHILGLNGDHTI